MKKNIIGLLFVLFLGSCKQNVAENDIDFLNGYWEIEKVDLADGKDKDYKMNEIFDFFEIKNKVGYRKKLMPQFDGTFLANDVSQKINILFTKDGVFVKQKTEYTEVLEEIVELSKDKLVLKKGSVRYFYKKAGPINLLNDGKEIK